jgi:2-polyprenyl-6-methoxyphenol hydroxylase-like FAD-dependent oxidoreductase
MAAAHPDWRAGVIVAQDGGRWVVTMGGYFGDRAPSDDQGFLAYARSLPGPEIYDVIKDAEPLDDPTPYHFPSSLRRRYERLARFPEGYLAFGDALCSFNPIYGQGMSVAAMEAVALRETLEKGPDALARRFFAAAAKVIDTPWQMAVGADLAHPKVEGPRPLPVRFINWYVRKLFQAGARDPIVAKRFIEVANLLRPPPALMNPSIAWRVWRAHAFA